MTSSDTLSTQVGKEKRKKIVGLEERFAIPAVMEAQNFISDPRAAKAGEASGVLDGEIPLSTEPDAH